MKERLQKLMAQANIASRRESEKMIEEGRVRVNGEVITVGAKADPETDVITVDGQRLKFDTKKIYIALYKPLNVVSTNDGRHGDERRTVRQLVPHKGHLFTIGRLDAESEGLMVLTNDGTLTHKLTHPRYGHTKTYKVTVYGLPPADAIAQWEQGIYLDNDEGKTAPCAVKIIDGDKGLTTLRIVMTEGKKRQIRRVARILGYPVRRLLRTHIGLLDIAGLRPGEWRELTPQEVKLMSQPAAEYKLRRKANSKAPFTAKRRSSAAGDQAGERKPSRPASGGTSTDNRKPRRPAAGDTSSGTPERKPRRPASSGTSSGTERKPRRPAGGTSNDNRKPRRPSDRKPKGRSS